jgi:DNA-binding winged helix-turn-helix (wHTH) protein/tetratricopeptide (TPR) repeat protein
MIYSFDNYRIDAARRVLLHDDQTVPLTPRIFDTLLYLVQHHDQVVGKEELLRAIWPDVFVEENNLTQSISGLRRALGERKGDNRFVVTVAGHGYRFAAPVTISRVEVKPDEKATTIAVLPFKPLVVKDRDEALELGMADALILRLSNNNQLIVRPITSVRRFTGLDQDAQSAGRELGVNSILDGSIQRSANRIRVNARLTNVADGKSLWTGTFDDDFTDVFTVQDAISERVAGALKLTLNRNTLTKRFTVNTQAYELYLQGRYHWNKLLPSEVRKSVEFYKRAIEIDPHYALAYTGIALAHISFPISADVEPSDSFPHAKAAALKALSLDETLADAHAYLAFIKCWFDWDWTGAESELQRAFNLNPNSAEAHRGYGILLSSLRKFDEAVIHGRRARELDPLALITRGNEAMFLYYAEHLDEAEERLKSTLELEPNFWIALLMLGKVYVRQGKHSAAIDVLNKARDASGGSSQPLAMLGFVYALMQEVAQSRSLLRELENLATKRYVPPYNFALVHYGLNDHAKAFEWLERACEVRDVLLSAFINSEPFWESLRTEPRFRSLLKRMNLPVIQSRRSND